MSSLAEQALEHARQRLAGQPTRAAPTTGNSVIKTPTSAVAKINTPASAPISTSFVPSGPISQHLYLEGRAWAVELVASMRSEPAAKVIERLTGATAGKPTSYVKGVHSVIEALQHAVVNHHPTGKPVLGTELEVRPCA